MVTIYGADLSTPANKVRFVANALGLEYNYQRVDLSGGEHRSEKFLKLHPAGKIPVLQDDNFILFESNAIIKYLAEKNNQSFYDKDLRQRALIDQWIDFSSLHIGQAMNRIVFNRIFANILKTEPDERSLNDGISFLKRFLPVTNQQLERHEFLAGSHRTLADFNLLSILDPAEIAQIDLSPYAALTQWRDKLKAESFYTQCHTSYEQVLESMKSGR